MYHIHLASTAETLARWAEIEQQYYRIALREDPVNDYWLIYAYDYFKDEYLLLTITGSDAHNRKEWGSFLRTVQNAIVKPWIVGKLLSLTWMTDH